MLKKLMALTALAAALFLVSCSDSETTKPAPSDSQAMQGEMNDVMTDLMTTPGSSALMNNMQTMDYLPFSFPSVPLKSLPGSINVPEAPESQMEIFQKLFPVRENSSKQEEHFIFDNWLGTYTFNGYVYDDYGNIIGANDWLIDYTNTTNITVIVPAAYTNDGQEFRLVLNNYNDEYITWNYEDEPGYMYDDYFPTLIDMEVYTAGTKVLDLDFTGDWEYMSAMDDVMPLYLNITLALDPFLLTITYTNNPTNVLNYSMSLKENQETRMSFDAVLTFTDGTLDEISEVDLGYMFGIYYIDFWTDVIATDTLMSNESLTADQMVDELNTEEYMFCHIFENDVQIGQLKAKKVWDEDAWNEDTQDYGAFVVVPYIEFNDGSVLSEDELEAMFGDMGLGK